MARAGGAGTAGGAADDANHLTCIKEIRRASGDKSPQGPGILPPSPETDLNSMANARASQKTMTIGEGARRLPSPALALLSIVIAAKAYTPEYAFHAYLFTRRQRRGGVRHHQPLLRAPGERAAADRSTASPTTTWGRSSSRPSPPCSGASPASRSASIIALELAFPALNFDLPWITFGRLRPLHTSAVIFAFGGNVLIATSFYVVQRTCRARLAGDIAPWFVVLGYNFFIVIAGTGYLLGITQSKEYAEPEWYADLWLTVVWVVYFLVFSRHHHAAHRAAHLRRQLVLSRLHPHHRGAASRQQRRDAGFAVLAEVLHRLVRRAGCDGAVVVRPQRGRLLPHRRLPRASCTTSSRSARPAGLFLSAVDHPLLVADLPLHLGRPASSALHGAARLGADARHDLLDHAVDAVLGRHDQRPHDAVRARGTSCAPIRCCA